MLLYFVAKEMEEETKTEEIISERKEESVKTKVNIFPCFFHS